MRNIPNKCPVASLACEHRWDQARTPVQARDPLSSAPPGKATPHLPRPRFPGCVSSPLEGIKSRMRVSKWSCPVWLQRPCPAWEQEGSRAVLSWGQVDGIGGRDSHWHIPSVHCQETASLPAPEARLPRADNGVLRHGGPWKGMAVRGPLKERGERSAVP